MTRWRRKTVAKPVRVGGVGVHLGVAAEVVIEAPEYDNGTRESVRGLIFRRLDVKGGAFGRLRYDHAVASPLCTMLRNDQGVTVHTVEHLLAALCGLGVTDALVTLDGPELPIGDGSAQLWVDALDKAGVVDIAGDVEPVVVTERVEVVDGQRRLVAVPAEDWEMAVEVDFEHPLIGRQRFGGVVSEEWFRREIMRARTFTLESEVRALQAAGFGKGGGLHCAVVFGDNGQVLNPEGLRWPDEPVRHKMLDALGDLYLAGRPLRGAFEFFAPGHSANNVLLRRLVGYPV